ncbi:MAG: hypothetical protein HOW73_26105 [Polyangiaceae bacterium]|nr:hypothetical protein [Polyangiaceae bacterium]
MNGLVGRASSVAAIAAVLVLMVPAVAAAQADPQKAALAQTLFEEADKAMNAKNYAEACPKLEKVVELIPEGIGAKETLADCYEGAGRLASAFGALVAVEGASVRAGQADRAQKARDRMAALKPRVATLTIELGDSAKGVTGLALKRDGADVSSAEIGLPVKVDKGEHVIVATAAGKPGFEKRITVADGEKQTVKIELTGEGGTTPDTGPKEDGGKKDGGTTGPQTGKPDTTTAGETNFFSPLRIAGLGIGIGGIAALGAGIGVGMHAKSLYDESNETGGCSADTNQCNGQDGVDLRDDAVMMGNVSTGLVIAGGVLAAGGIVMFAVAPSDKVEVGLGPGSLTLTTAF